MNKQTTSERVFQVINYIILLLLGFTTLYPLWSTIVQSLSNASTSDIYNMWIKDFTFSAYSTLLQDKEIWMAYANTIFRTVVGTFLSVLVTAMYAYPLSRKEMPFKGFFGILMIITMMFSGGMIPVYLLIKSLHLLDNRLVYILPGLMSAYNAIIMRNYFASLPEAVVESALIDGASERKIFFSIIIPLSMPVLATVALWNAVGHWNSWFDSMLYFNDTSKQTLQLYLQRMLENNTITGRIFQGEDITFTTEGLHAATIVVAVLPMLIVYPFIQKYFVKGITLGSVKG